MLKELKSTHKNQIKALLIKLFCKIIVFCTIIFYEKLKIKFMKFFKSLFLCCFLSTILLVSCRKSKETIDEIQTTFELSTNQAISDNLTQDVNDVFTEVTTDNGLVGGRTDEVMQTNNTLSCASVTISGNFPTKNILIDFGAGCTSQNGVFRKGKINIVLTDSVRKTGSTATLTFDNYYVNTYKKEGTIVWTNNTVQGATTRSWNRKVTNGKITAINGNYWLHTSDINITQTAGVNTVLNLLDDIYTITGTRTVTNSNGVTRTSTTQTPLQKKTICTNIDSGILKVQGTNHYAIIDYGNGTCDNTATVSIDGRPSITVTLR